MAMRVYRALSFGLLAALACTTWFAEGEHSSKKGDGGSVARSVEDCVARCIGKAYVRLLFAGHPRVCACMCVVR